MNDNKNMILAVVLSAIVLFGWSFVSERYFPTANPPVTRIEKGARGRDAAAAGEPGRRTRRRRSATARSCCARRPRVAIRTPRLAGSINLKGARIDDLVLTDQRETIAANSPPVRLFSPGRHARRLFRRASAGPARASRCPAPTRSGRPAAPALTPATPVTLSWNNGQGQIFEILLVGRRRLSVHRRADA